MKRWTCPTCGAGALAPAHPRADDVRRYCLACSKRTGRLVRRTCPSAERERTARRDALRADRAADRARRADRELAHWTRAGLDVRDVAARCWRALGAPGPMPRVQVRWRHDGTPYSGHAFDKERVVVSFPATADAATVWMVVLHELAHCATPRATLPDGRRDVHGLGFNKRLCEAAEKLWGFSVPIARGYEPSRHLERRLRGVLAERNPGSVPPPAPVVDADVTP